MKGSHFLHTDSSQSFVNPALPGFDGVSVCEYRFRLKAGLRTVYCVEMKTGIGRAGLQMRLPDHALKVGYFSLANLAGINHWYLRSEWSVFAAM